VPLVAEVAACLRERTGPRRGAIVESNFLETDVLKSLLAFDRTRRESRGRSTAVALEPRPLAAGCFQSGPSLSESGVNGFSQRYRNDFVGHLPIEYFQYGFWPAWRSALDLWCLLQRLMAAVLR